MPTTIPTVTSSTRPGSPSAGDAYFETDTKDYIIYDGASWRSYVSDGSFSSGSFPSNSYSAYFDGSNDYIDTGSRFNFIQQTCEFSITCWLKFNDYDATSGTVNQSIIATTPTGNVEGLYFFYDSRGGTRNLKVILRGATSVALSATNGIGDNNWHHYAITCSGPGGSLSLLKDGVSIASGTAPAVSSSSANHTMHLGIGVNAGPTLYGPLIDAYLDEVAVFNRQLTSSEIDDIRATPYSYIKYTSLYRLENNANDEAGANNGTNNGATFVTSSKPY